MKKNNDIKVIIPTELLKDMEFHSTAVTPFNKNVGILILQKGLNHFTKEIIIRLYRLQRDRPSDEFVVYYELQAFSFTTYYDAKKFLNHLPRMTALEMLLMLNPPPHAHQFQ